MPEPYSCRGSQVRNKTPFIIGWNRIYPIVLPKGIFYFNIA
jgi:hypothetical protein